MSNTTYNLDTRLGPLQITFTEANHAHIHTYNDKPVTAFGVQYAASIHVYLWNDGRFHIGPEYRDRYGNGEKELTDAYYRRDSLYLSRIGNICDHGTQAAWKRIADAIDEAANNFVVNNPAILREAERVKLFRDVEAAESDAAEKYEAWKVAHNLVVEAKRSLAHFDANSKVEVKQ